MRFACRVCMRRKESFACSLPSFEFEINRRNTCSKSTHTDTITLHQHFINVPCTIHSVLLQLASGFSLGLQLRFSLPFFRDCLQQQAISRSLLQVPGFEICLVHIAEFCAQCSADMFIMIDRRQAVFGALQCEATMTSSDRRLTRVWQAVNSRLQALKPFGFSSCSNCSGA